MVPLLYAFRHGQLHLHRHVVEVMLVSMVVSRVSMRRVIMLVVVPVLSRYNASPSRNARCPAGRCLAGHLARKSFGLREVPAQCRL